jgi:hypothetical protein
MSLDTQSNYDNIIFTPFRDTDFDRRYPGILNLETCQRRVARKGSKNMDALWRHFHEIGNYPEFYLGIAEKMAICRCPDTGKDEWFNGKTCLSITNPIKGSTVTVHISIKGTTYLKDFVFMGWVKFPVHEWRMKSGEILQLEKNFIDKLVPAEKRFLKVYR